jgi:hypothetical protein
VRRPNQSILTVELLSLEVNADLGVSPLVTDVITLVPDLDLACVLAVGDGALKTAEDRVAVFGLGNDPLDPWPVRQPLVGRPTLIDSVLFEAEVEMTRTIMMLLYHELHGRLTSLSWLTMPIRQTAGEPLRKILAAAGSSA